MLLPCYYIAIILMLHWWDIVVGLWVVVGRCTNGANAGFDDRRLLIGRSSGAMVVYQGVAWCSLVYHGVQLVAVGVLWCALVVVVRSQPIY